jgi:uncharacterized protein (TIGR00251 family)
MFTCIVKVVPSSGRSMASLDKNNQLKWYLKSPPEDGKANQELIKAVAQALKVPQKMVTIVTGATSRTKLIRVTTDHTYEQLLDAVGIEKQMTI